MKRLPRDKAKAFVVCADVLVSPRAFGDNLPLKIIDYMSAAKPIVATRIPAHTAVLDSTRAVLTDTDGASLAEGIRSVLNDPDKARRIAMSARDYGEQHFGWGAFTYSVRSYRDRVLGEDTDEPEEVGAGVTKERGQKPYGGQLSELWDRCEP